MNRWLGIAIVAVGVAVAALGTWYVMHARPKVGALIDTIPADRGQRVLVHAEADGPNSFVTLMEGDREVWDAYVPTYGGRAGAPGIAVGKTCVSIRIVRDGKAEIFALARNDAQKLGGMGLGHGHGPIDADAKGPITLTDHERSYEVVSGPDWHQLVAFDLTSGKPLWSVELGDAPVTDGGIEDHRVWVSQGQNRHSFEGLSGKPI